MYYGPCGIISINVNPVYIKMISYIVLRLINCTSFWSSIKLK